MYAPKTFKNLFYIKRYKLWKNVGKKSYFDGMEGGEDDYDYHRLGSTSFLVLVLVAQLTVPWADAFEGQW